MLVVFGCNLPILKCLLATTLLYCYKCLCVRVQVSNSLRICAVPEARYPTPKTLESPSWGEGFDEWTNRVRGVRVRLLCLTSDVRSIYEETEVMLKWSRACARLTFCLGILWVMGFLWDSRRMGVSFTFHDRTRMVEGENVICFFCLFVFYWQPSPLSGHWSSPLQESVIILSVSGMFKSRLFALQQSTRVPTSALKSGSSPSLIMPATVA